MGLVDLWGAWCLTDGSLAEKDFTNTSLAKGLVLPSPKKIPKASKLDPKAPEKAKAGQQNQ